MFRRKYFPFESQRIALGVVFLFIFEVRLGFAVIFLVDSVTLLVLHEGLQICCGVVCHWACCCAPLTEFGFVDCRLQFGVELLL